jgi:hypothetical protein
MTPFDGLGQAWHWSVRKFLGLWVRVIVKPEDAAGQIAALPRPVCYVLEHESQVRSGAWWWVHGAWSAPISNS